MKKIMLLMGLAGFFMVVSADVPAAECHRGLAKISSSGSASGDETASTLAPSCSDEKGFHVPAAVPLFLSAIAGLGIVAFRGKAR